MSAEPSGSRAWPSDALTARIGSALFWLLLCAVIGIVAFTGPIVTSDGPAHVSIAHAIVVANDPAWPMLHRLYDVTPILTPNALGHYLLAALMLTMPPLAAEQALQIVCVAGIPLAGRLVLRQLNPSAGWLALFFFPVALETNFVMGLYNYCLSVVGCLLSVWAWLRLRERPTAGRTVLLAVILLLTLSCQASGWLEALVAVATMAGAECLLRLWRGERLGAAALRPAAAAFAFLPSALLFSWFMRQTAGAPVVYGTPPAGRLMDVLRGAPFATIGRETALSALVMTGLLAALIAAGLVAWLRPARRTGNHGPQLVAVLLLPLAFVAFLMIIPDTAGGGWTHTWRAEPFPFIGMTLVCALLPIALRLRQAAVLLSAAGALTSIGMVAKVQIWDAPPVLREFNEADALIPAHCSVAPVLGQFKLDPANTAQLFHHPMFHAADRFELRADRPVLFSYVARLPVYPARFKPTADPQKWLYGWTPYQRDTRVYTIDITRFESASGMTVDYVLLWDIPDAAHAGPYASLREAISRSGYPLVYRSSSGRMELYRRPGSDSCGGT